MYSVYVYKSRVVCLLFVSWEISTTKGRKRLRKLIEFMQQWKLERFLYGVAVEDLKKYINWSIVSVWIYFFSSREFAFSKRFWEVSKKNLVMKYKDDDLSIRDAAYLWPFLNNFFENFRQPREKGKREKWKTRGFYLKFEYLSLSIIRCYESATHHRAGHTVQNV